ncbi:potassium channel family protein [Halobaculum magnesiiphilum]|uniref:TrkA family potassium uptake protein n=1 Tax=Halobaculum magnesiiphilum TaxID=1017351 RepID=A0A8T8W8S2_9EURY|nr:TrkA family potassium uptake protein [Halobaculum magnesiiphilum]QZP36245.1 TrkA family potassium uptake protein [Halobaculum magnesiiphilum]
MKIVIVGYGRVGSRTARVLDEEGHDVVVVDNDHTKVERARERGFRVIEGDGSNPSVLADAGVADSDAVGGITGDPKLNFDICMEAKELGDCRTVMRVSEDFHEEIYDEFERAVDEIIYPERLGAAGAKTAMLGGDFNAIGDLTERLQLVTIAVDDDAPVIGGHVNELSVDGGRVYAHGRAREPLTIPLPGTTVESGDRIAVLAETERVGDVRAALLGE